MDGQLGAPRLNHTPLLARNPFGRVTQHRPHPDPSQPQRPPPGLRTPASPELSLAELPQYCEGSWFPLLGAARSPRGEREGGGRAARR